MGATAHCSRCDHAWQTRKSPDDIDRPRCSECGAEQDAITFGKDGANDPGDTGGDVADSDILQTAKRDRHVRELRDRVSEQIDRVVGTTPEDADHPVARELRPSYWELHAIEDHLTEDRPESFSPDTLSAVRDRVAEIKAEIDDHAPELATADGLADKIGDLQSERHALQVEIEELRAEVEDLERKREAYNDVVKRRDEKEEVWKAGYEYGRSQGRIEGRELAEIQVPCARCGTLMTMKPDSQMHQLAIELFQRIGWKHTSC
ncbi:MAG: hypothetical protein ABEH88_10465 [Halobacteriales archaeon]